MHSAVETKDPKSTWYILCVIYTQSSKGNVRITQIRNAAASCKVAKFCIAHLEPRDYNVAHVTQLSCYLCGPRLGVFPTGFTGSSAEEAGAGEIRVAHGMLMISGVTGSTVIVSSSTDASCGSFI